MESGDTIRLLRVQGVQGYLPGWRQPAVIIDIHLPGESDIDTRQTLDNAILERTKESLPEELVCGASGSPTIRMLINNMLALLRHGGWPVFHAGETHRHDGSPDTARLIVPSVHGGEAVIHAMVRGFLALLIAGTDRERPDTHQSLEEIIGQIRRAAPGGINTLRFIEAANSQRIPWFRLAGNLYQFGWGQKARLLDSSFTDATPLIAARLARDKRVASRLLRQAGVPVPKQLSAHDLKAALAATRSLGFPVVVKPSDSDGGKGVHAFLSTEEEVKNAFEQASRVSRNIVIEKHFIGNDYRLQVFQGQVYSANERIPASVTGDGASSVSELVEITNADPRRGPPGSPLLKWIVLDDEAHSWLHRQSLTTDSVPAEGQFVRLRGAANIASGGNIQPVLDAAHPDNLRLAERAVRILRLDIAGVDLLIPDIRHSWQDTGAAICEINAQPQMAPELPAHVLQQLVEDSGRIPVVVMTGSNNGEEFRALAQRISDRHDGVGIAGSAEVSIAGQSITLNAADSFQGAQFLLRDPSVKLIVLHVQDSAILQFGVPFDHIDHLVIAGAQARDKRSGHQVTTALNSMLARMATNRWILNGAGAFGTDSSHRRASLDEVVESILRGH